MRAGWRFESVLLAGLATLCPLASHSDSKDAPYAIASRVEAHPYLRMPARPDGDIPKLLSQTGAFKDTPHLVPSDQLLPYDLIVPFWSDGAQKLRWIAVPKGKIESSPSGEWTFPAGTVFVKTFELPVDARDPTRKRRLETRLLMVQGGGLVYGVVYKWRADLSDADLLPDSLTEKVPITNAAGETHSQSWYYPSRKDCITCHTKLSGGVLGVKARQMNRDFAYPTGVSDNELREWNHLGLFATPLGEAGIKDSVRLAAEGDETRSFDDRARSYLDANCSQCHRPGGTVADFDARYDTPLERQGLVNGRCSRSGHRSSTHHLAARYLEIDRVHAGRYDGRHPHAADRSGDHRPSRRRAAAAVDRQHARPAGAGSARHRAGGRHVRQARARSR